MSYDYDQAKYGQFKCDCGRMWYSSKAWQNFGQICTKCNLEVRASKLWLLGRYNCFKCERSWKTKFDQQNGCRCDKCGEKIYPLPANRRNPFIKPKILETEAELELVKIDPSKRHQQELCEKCTYYGKDCCHISKAETKTRSIIPKSAKINDSSIKSNSFKELEKPIAMNSYNFNPGINSVNLSHYSVLKNENPIHSLADIMKEEQKAAKSDDSMKKSTMDSNANIRYKTDSQKIASEIQNTFTYFAKSKTNSNPNNLEQSDGKTCDHNYEANELTFNYKPIGQTSDQSTNYFTDREEHIKTKALNSRAYLTEIVERNISHPENYSSYSSRPIYTPKVREENNCVIF